ncbi:YaaA family protein [Mycoplasmatota bacterium WC44]
MKIIVSPSKTMQFKNTDINGIEPMFLDRTESIIKILKGLSKEELGKLYKIKGDMLNNVFSNINNFDSLDENIAINAYTGLVFKGLEINNYNESDWNYLNNKVIILSAFYGLLTPSTLIKQYRLDFNCMKDLYSLWKDVGDYIDEPIVNLASNEFSKMIDRDMINIGFREFKDGNYKNLATYSKQARGVMLNYLIKNSIEDVNNIKLFCENNYSFNNELSDEKNFIFTR